MAKYLSHEDIERVQEKLYAIYSYLSASEKMGEGHSDYALICAVKKAKDNTDELISFMTDGRPWWELK